MLQNGGAVTAAADVVKDTTTQSFMKDVIEESKRQPVLVDFWAPWCGPCKQLTPILEKAVKAAKGKVKLAKMNIDEHPAIPGQMGIQSIPAVIAFSNGQPVDGFMGALPESQVVAFLERLTKDKIGGEEGLLEGRRRGAWPAAMPRRPPRSTRKCCRRTPATCRRSPVLRAATSRPARSSRPRQTLALVPEAKAQRCGGGRRARRARSCRAGEVGRPARRAREEGRRQSARSSGALRSRHRAQRQRASAPRPPSICSRSSSATANGTRTRARKQLVQFFEAWGFADPAAVEGRKRLSSILFS